MLQCGKGTEWEDKVVSKNVIGHMTVTICVQATSAPAVSGAPTYPSNDKTSMPPSTQPAQYRWQQGNEPDTEICRWRAGKRTEYLWRPHRSRPQIPNSPLSFPSTGHCFYQSRRHEVFSIKGCWFHSLPTWVYIFIISFSHSLRR